MTTVFTICSANYLAHAKTLGDSVAEHNPEFHFVIGLVDRVPKGVDPSFWHPFELITVEEIGIPAFWDMVQRYDLVELNTAVKPFYIEHIYRRDPAVEAVIYLDPDILVYASLERLAETLRTYPIVVTPHSCTFDDTAVNIYYERGMLTTGIYNLGFLGTSRADTSFAFLDWWQKRLQENCYLQQGNGAFVDQLWVTLAPLYFRDVYVERDPGYNMCYWNHFERRLSRHGGRYVVNGEHDLVFYHFSSYNPLKPNAIASRLKSQTATFSERPDLKEVFDDYGSRLLAHGYVSMTSLPWLIPRRPPTLTPKRAAKEGLRRLLRAAPSGVRSRLKQAAQLTLDALK